MQRPGRTAALIPVLLLVAGEFLHCRPKPARPSDRQEDARPPAPAREAAGTNSGARPSTVMPPGFVKGQLHVHTSASADSNTAPLDVHRWYEQRGYDFVVFTDHNVVTDTKDTGMLTVPGAELTWNLRACEPPPPRGKTCALHMNVLFATADDSAIVFGEVGSVLRRDVYSHELQRAKALGGIAMLNHPNMESGADEALVLELSRQGLTLLEVGNQSWDADNETTAEHPSSEAIWDGVLSRGARVFATVTDDAHHYADAAAMRARGERPFTGDLGFVVVRADKSLPQIRAAISRGEFYGSTGVVFDTYEVGSETISLATQGGAPVLFEVVGRGGVVVRTERAAKLDVKLAKDDGPYLRVRAKADDGTFAWTQPVFRTARGDR